MKSDKELKKLIDGELDGGAPVEQFIDESGIVFDKNGRRHSGEWLEILVPAAACAAVALAIVLPLTISSGADELNYSSAEIVSIETDIAAVRSNADIRMYDGRYEVMNNGCFTLVESGNAKLVLGYKIYDVVYCEDVSAMDYVVMFDYFVRCYDNYEFADIALYATPEYELTVGGIKFRYGIYDGNLHRNAMISFEVGDYDYFIALRDCNNITEITQDSVEKFIGSAFGGYKQ